MVSTGDGLQKRKGINKGFVISCLLLLSESLPALPELWDSAEALRQECCMSLFPPAKTSLCSFSLAPKKSLSSGMLELWHTRSCVTPQPPTSSPCCQKTHLPSSYTVNKPMANIYPQLLGEWMSTDCILWGTTHRSVSRITLGFWIWVLWNSPSSQSTLLSIFAPIFFP